MSWPLSQDYNEAVQNPDTNFADPDLRWGTAAINALGIPQPCSGASADVYQLACPDGSRWAVKCFTRETPGLRERYRKIGRHLRRAKLPFVVKFNYLEQGIRVAGTWYPVLKMQWADGLTLNRFVGEHLDNPAMLEALARIWTRTARRLRAAEVAHCDLQHGNILLVPELGGNAVALKLIDYDGMWVPSLAGTDSCEFGHPSYQHPRRPHEKAYSLEVDRFPVLVIATALRALAAEGRRLWERFDNGDNLLFKTTDFQAPTQSALFLALIRSSDPIVAALADHLLTALRGGPESAPLLEEAILEALPADVPQNATTPGVQSAAPLPDWVSAMAEAGLDVEELESLSAPPPDAWLEDVRRLEKYGRSVGK